MSKMIRALGKPCTMAVAAANRSVDRLEGPLKQHIVQCEAQGEDVCTEVWKEYTTAQKALLGYRLQQLRREFRYVFSGEMAVATLSFRDFVIFARFATKCLLLFIFAVMLGRRSVYPSLEPTSVFVEEVVKNWPPNHIQCFHPIPQSAMMVLRTLDREE